MANPHRGAVALEAEDQVYTLRFTTNSICELEDHLGKSIAKIVNDLQDESRVSLNLVRALAWGALLDGKPDFTVKDAGKVLDDVGMSVMTEKVGLALQRFFPEQEGDEKSNPQKAAKNR